MRVVAKRSLGFVVNGQHHVVHTGHGTLPDEAKDAPGFDLCVTHGELTVLPEPEMKAEPETGEPKESEVTETEAEAKETGEAEESEEEEESDKPEAAEGGVQAAPSRRRRNR